MKNRLVKLDVRTASSGNFFMVVNSSSETQVFDKQSSSKTYTITAFTWDTDTMENMTSKCGRFIWNFKNRPRRGVTIIPSADTRTCTVKVETDAISCPNYFSVFVRDASTEQGFYYNDDTDYINVSRQKCIDFFLAKN